MSRDPHMTPFGQILHLFRYNGLHFVSVPNLNFLTLTLPLIFGGLKIPKVGHVTPTWPLLTLFCIFFVRTQCRPFPCHIWSLEVSSFNRSRNIAGVPTFRKWVRWPPYYPFWPNFAFFSLEFTLLSQCKIWSLQLQPFPRY